MLKKYEEIIRYGIAGFLTTLVSLLSYNLLRNTNIDYKVSTIISWILAVVFAYFINNYFVFKNTKKDLKEFIEFIKYRIFSLLVEYASMYIMVDLIIINDRIAKLIVQVIVFVLNYIFSKFFVFKK